MTERPVIEGHLLLILAVATGAVVANLYFCQPILPRIASAFHHSVASLTFVVTATQIGYAAGLALLVPLGDIISRKRLVPAIFLVAAFGCILCALAPSLVLFLVASAIVGMASVAGQILIPFVADFAPPERRSRSVARLMSGLLFGILLARTFSGVIAEFFGWRSVYFASTITMAGFAVLLYLSIPVEPKRSSIRYQELLGAAVMLMIHEPVLRRRSLLGALAFGGFAVLWSSLSWQLSREPFAMNSLTIGLFGIIGLSGVFAANMVGRIADKGHGKMITFQVTLFAGAAVLLAFLFFLFGASSLYAIVFGVILLDAGTQGVQLSNQTLIYNMISDSRSRITSAYMFTYFLGGTLGSALAGIALERSGWRASSLVGLGFGCGVLVLSYLELRRHQHASRVGAR
ncbi:MAG TPA: MFS transporter [Acidimicrobiales bacterium]|nr:MFS transporter [Acidimicrobiales bacterium]